ncbi:M23 family metallopeptidase [Anaeromicropila herbilytica]|nr:M23 family metallopeptidase [Anaeromicropila herbilytica]
MKNELSSVRKKRKRNYNINKNINKRNTEVNIKKSVVMIMGIVIFVNCILTLIVDLQRNQSIHSRFIAIEFKLEEFREIDIANNKIQYIKEKAKDKNVDFIELLTFNMIYHHYHIDKNAHIITNLKPYNKYLKNKKFKEIYQYYQCVFSDLSYFPIPINKKNKIYVNFDDSWKNSRTYGGKRFHEGTDIMSDNNVRGYFPVLSISQGIVEKKGWLEQGGYRLGIRAKNGAYFYYAHLYSYAPELKIGDTIMPGQLLGFMGDTGYSKVEGTVGNFDVHLHVGIYFDYKDQEVSVNPYWILRYLSSYKLSYYY